MIRLIIKEKEIIIDTNECNLDIHDGKIYVDNELVGVGDCEFHLVEDENVYGIW